MPRFSRLTLRASLAFCLAALAGTYAQETPEALAQETGEQWLTLLDAGKYGESWDAASEGFKETVSRQDWVNQLKARAALGKVISRKVTKSDLMTNPPDVPPGDYVGIRYASSFEHLESAVELVIPMLEKDGKWRVSNYLIRRAD